MRHSTHSSAVIKISPTAACWMQAPYMQLRPPGMPQQQQAYPYRPVVCQPPAAPISPGAPAKNPQVLPSKQTALLTSLCAPRSMYAHPRK